MDVKRKSKHSSTFSHDRETSMKMRTSNFEHAAKRLFAICGGGKFEKAAGITTLTPFSPHLTPAEGIKQRPNLMCYESVFLELSDQALLF